MSRPIIVFTDLDGCLLDHQDYGYAAALPALERLRDDRIPLVLCSSKTAAEIQAIRDNPEFRDCAAIVENGAGVMPAAADSARPAPTHARLMSLVDRLPSTLREKFSGISSWTLEMLQRRTGLDPDSARRAACRDYTEPGLWSDDDDALQRFIAELRKLGIVLQRGGRFLTLGFPADKADRMKETIEADQALAADAVVTVALGDAPNDIAMLERADFGIIVPNPAHAGIPTLAGEVQGRIVRAQAAGPAGWSNALLTLLDDPDFKARAT